MVFYFHFSFKTRSEVIEESFLEKHSWPRRIRGTRTIPKGEYEQDESLLVAYPA
jgi:hypothetical protein